ncbi:MAG: AAA family ATPase [Candidatus Paceibacterota bacterium]
MEIEQIIQLSALAKKQVVINPNRRDLYSLVSNHQDKTYLGIIGPRGVGKTVLLKQLHQANQASIYISLDSLDRNTNLFELVKVLHENYKFQIFYLDEIHFLNETDKYLKNIFDFLDVHIIFTSSISLKLYQSAYDLSRRVKLVNLYSFSFREFLKFSNFQVPKALSLEEILNENFSPEHTSTAIYLKQYLQGANYPISLEVSDLQTALKNNLDKIIYSDIPRTYKLTFDELDLIMKAFKFIARAPVSDINGTTLANNLKITRYKAIQYLDILERAFIINQIQPWGTNVLKEPKVLLTLPYRLLEQEFSNALGGLREDFAVDCLLRSKINFNYLKTKIGKKTPDLILNHNQEHIIIEIGGKNKSARQFKDVDPKLRKMIFSDSDLHKPGHLPLVLLGFLE